MTLKVAGIGAGYFAQYHYDAWQRIGEIRLEAVCDLDGSRAQSTAEHHGIPTVFTDVKTSMRIANEEIFGPVISILPFENEEEAISISNDTAYGLTNYIQTKDKGKAHRIAKQLRSGMVEINGNGFTGGTPFGGYKQSGNGREGGSWGLEEYLEVKTISGWK